MLAAPRMQVEQVAVSRAAELRALEVAAGERDSKPFLVVIPPDGDRRFVDPMRWFYCGADSDLDSLE